MIVSYLILVYQGPGIPSKAPRCPPKQDNPSNLLGLVKFEIKVIRLKS